MSTSIVDLVVMSEDGSIVLPIAVPGGSELATILQQIAIETQIPVNQIRLSLNGEPLKNLDLDKTLADLGITADSVLTFKAAPAGNGSNGRSNSRSSPLSPTSIAQTISALGATSGSLTLQDIPAELFSQPAALHAVLKAAPHLMSELRGANPQMADAASADTPGPLTEYLRKLSQARAARERAMIERQRKLELDPLNVELQREIEEEIRLQNVEANLELAMEHNPEAFGSVYMLYVPMIVNGHKLAAFVDSGAQSTIMSEACAQRCGIMRLIDRRFAGIARGVGTSKILGRVHAVPVKVGSLNITCSFTILENQDMDFLFGLDQLRTHQACIDLKANVLSIGGESIPFLAEKDIPKESAFQNMDAHEETKSASSSSSSVSQAPATNPGTNAAPNTMRQPPQPSSQPQSAGGLTSDTNLAGQLLLGTLMQSLAAANPNLLQALQQQQQQQPQPSQKQGAAQPAAQGQSQGPRQTSAGLTPTATPTPSTASASQSTSAHESYSPAVVQNLVDMGFSESEVRQALNLCNGDADLAAAMLFQNHSTAP